ncbi:hypothetical protein MP228_012859 [Amoeboaphelidium protococcarum]|nr:hypothetical protein MP228_012859 [Amoeboaphelidium protococcarum]
MTDGLREADQTSSLTTEEFQRLVNFLDPDDADGLTIQIDKGPACNEREIQHHSNCGQLTVIRRTVVFYGWDLLLLTLPYVVIKLEQYRPEYLSLDVRNKRLSFRARSDAVRLFSDKRFKILTLPDKTNIKFASNYPRARCSSDFGLTEVYRVHPSEMDNNLRSYSAREIGSAFLKEHFNQVAAWLTSDDWKIAQQFGGLWLGGFEIWEPYSIGKLPETQKIIESTPSLMRSSQYVTSRRWQGDIIDYYCTSEKFGRTQLKFLSRQFIAETGIQHELNLMRFDFCGMGSGVWCIHWSYEEHHDD